MKVQFNQNVTLPSGELVANQMDMATVLRDDGVSFLVHIDSPINSKYPELLVPKAIVWTQDIKSEVAMSIDKNVRDTTGPTPPKPVEENKLGFRVRTIGLKDIDLSAYQEFRNECKSLDGVTVPIAITKALDAANIAGDLMEYRALLLYTATELERQTKLKYSLAVGKAEGSSQDKREALAKQDTGYQDLLIQTAEVSALKQLVDDAYEHANKLHYFFKVVYQGESRVPVDTPFRG